jgi:hypothetical protein
MTYMEDIGEWREWVPAHAAYYDTNVNPIIQAGLHYDMLYVEQSNEGWHGILTEFDGDDLVIVDEAVFPTEMEAQEWALFADTSAYEGEER